MGHDNENGRTLYIVEPEFREEFCRLARLLNKKFCSNPSPNAPKDIEGSYTLTINGRTVTLSDGKIRASKTYHLDDNFDIGEGVCQCFEGLKKARKVIRVGDMVEIVGNDIYDIYKTGIFTHLDFDDKVKYDYNNVPKIGTKARVVCIGLHDDRKKVLAYVETNYNKSYLVGIESLRKVVD